MARESVCEKDYDESTREASFEFSDGTLLVLEVAKLSPEIQTRLMLHGAMQKVGDSYSSVRGNVVDAISRAKAVIAALSAGEWGPEREGGGTRVGLLAEAIARIKGVSPDTARAALQLSPDASDEDKKAMRSKISTLRSHPQIKATIARIQLERAEEEAKSAPELAI